MADERRPRDVSREGRRPDREQEDLQDARHGAYDPTLNITAPDKSHRTAHEQAQPGADVRGEPVPAKLPMEEYGLPEGLKRKRQGPLDKDSGRGVAQHVPQGGLRRKQGKSR
jgi:hypothetical protein